MGPREWNTIQGAAVRVRAWLGIAGVVLGLVAVALVTWGIVMDLRGGGR